MADPTLDELETSRSGNARQINGHFEGKRVFAIPREYLDTLSGDYMPSWKNTWPGDPPGGGAWVRTPQINEFFVERFHPRREGFAEVTCWYRTPTIRWPSQQAQVTGVLKFTTGTKIEKLGLEKPSTVAAERLKGVYTKVVSGSEYVPVPYPAWTIEALAIASWNPRSLFAYIGKINTAPAFGGAAQAEELLFLGGESQEPITTDDENSVWKLQLHFAQQIGGWNNVVGTQQWWKVPTLVQVRDAAGADVTGQWQTIAVDEPYPDANAVIDWDVTFTMADHNVFDQMLGYS